MLYVKIRTHCESMPACQGDQRVVVQVIRGEVGEFRKADQIDTLHTMQGSNEGIIR